MNDRKNLIPLFSTFLLWGSLYIVSKVALRTIPPVTLLAMRYLVSIPALFLLLKLRGVMKPLQREDFKTVLAIGVVGYFASFCLQMLGIDRLSGSVSSLLGAMNPIFIPILAAVFLKEKITAAKVPVRGCFHGRRGADCGGGWHGGSGGGGADAGQRVSLVQRLHHHKAGQRQIRPHAGGDDGDDLRIAVYGLWAAVELQSSPCTLTAPGLAAVLYMGLMGTAAAHTLWNLSLSRMDASFCSMFYPLQPLVSSVLGVLLLGEAITPGFVAGGLIICCGIVAAVLSGRKKA